jgi:hypothetical protein
MLTAEQAANKARDFFLALPSDLLNRGSSPTLEEIKEDGGMWHVVLSYLTDPNPRAMIDVMMNDFARALQVRRQFREFIVDASSGKVAMRNPANA